MTTISRRGFVKGAALAAPLAFSPFTVAQTSSAEHYDFVIAGAGHNSLITACYLQKGGFKCLVLEGRPLVGGGTKTAQLTLSGFHHDTCSSHHERIQANPLMRDNELQLGDYGLEYMLPDPVYHCPFPDGSYLTQWQDINRTCDEIARYSKKDAATYRRMAREAETIRPLLNQSSFMPPGWGKPSSQVFAEHPQGKLWQRRVGMSQWDLLHDNFEDERTMVLQLVPFPSHIASNPCTGPGTGLSAYPALHPNVPLAKGGSGMLAVALARCFEAHGGVVMVNKPVERLIVESGKCVGVECADGSSYRADKAVVSTIHIKRLVDMAPKDLWGDEFIEGVRTFKTGDASFNAHYATTIPIEFPIKGGTITPVHSSTLSSPRRALRFENELALGEFTWDDPVLHVVQTSVVDPSRVPQPGMQTLRILCEQSPYDLKDGGHERWQDIKEEVAKAHLKALQRLAPTLTDDKILGHFITTPVEIEQMNPSMWHGSCHGGAEPPTQLGAMRPVPGWGQYKMPIPGLYQTGATTHPGGSVSGGPGRNTAMVLLKEFGTNIEEVVRKKNA